MARAERNESTPGLGDRDHLTGLNVAHEARAHGVEGGALRRDRPAAAGQPPEGQRPEADRVAGGHQRLGGQHREGVGAGGAVERVVDALRPGPPRGMGDELGEDLGVRGRDELDTLLGELVAEPARVGEVAVVAEHQLAAIGARVDRLDVGQRVRAGRAVAGVADGRVRGGVPPSPSVEAAKRLLVEDAAHQPEALVQHQPLSVADGDAGRLLAAVLEGVKPDVGEARASGPPGDQMPTTPHSSRGPWGW